MREQEWVADAVLVVDTAAQMPSMQGQDGRQIREVVKEIQKAKQASPGAATVGKLTVPPTYSVPLHGFGRTK